MEPSDQNQKTQTHKTKHRRRYSKNFSETVFPMVATIENTTADSPQRLANPALPPLESYWKPQPETMGERVKLQLLHQISNFAGLLRPVLGRLSKSSVSVLTYHRIAPNYPGVPFPTINVTPDKFREQLLGLKRAGFQFASLSSVLDACDAANGAAVDVPERTVIVTFDDIYDNVFQNAWPVLQELNIPVTFFISTAFVDSKEPFLFDPWARQHQDAVPEDSWLPITDAHLRTMLKSDLVELGAHTDTHQDFRNRPQAFAADLAIGAQKLKQRYGTDRMSFAFPYGIPRMGFTSEVLMDITRGLGLGLRSGLSTGSHANKLTSSPFGWGRFHVFQHDNTRSLAAKIDGWYEWLPKIKNLLTRTTKLAVAE